MNQTEIARINELTQISRKRELTDAEKEERLALRQAYIASMKQSLTATLDHTYLVDEQGNTQKLHPKIEK